MNGYWDMVRISNDTTDYPSNMGQKWSVQEETLLLEELNNNMDVEIIAQRHNRTIGGINARRQLIAYNMYLKNASTEEIIRKTKLDYNCIKQIIEKKGKKNNVDERNTKPQIDNVFISINKADYLELQNAIKQTKNDIKEIRHTLGELVEMMKALYEFENS